MKRGSFHLTVQAFGLLALGLAAHAAGVDVSSTTPVTLSSSTVSVSSAPLVVMLSSAGSVTESTAPAVIVQPSTSSTVLLTLPDCIQRAINGATTVLLAKNQADYTGEQLLQAYAQFLPNLEGSGSYTYQSGRVYYTQSAPTLVSTKNHGGTFQLSSTLNIFAGGGDYANVRAGREVRQAADLSLVRAKQQISFDIMQAFLQVLLDRRVLQFQKTNREASQEREKLLDAQAQAGSRSLADLYRQQAETSADELAYINARSRTKDDLILLLRRLRVDLLTSYDVADLTLDNPAPNLFPEPQALVHEALQQRADLIAQEKTAQAAEWDVTLARSGYYPRLDLAGTAVDSGRVLTKQILSGASVLPPSQPSLGYQLGNQLLYTGGLQLTWGLFDRLATRFQVARAQQLAANALIDSEDYHLQVEGEVEQALNDYEGAADSVGATDKGLQSAQESYKAVNARYGVGASSIVDLLTAQTALVQAETAQVQAHIDYALQKRAVELAAGTLQP